MAGTIPHIRDVTRIKMTNRIMSDIVHETVRFVPAPLVASMNEFNAGTLTFVRSRPNRKQIVVNTRDSVQYFMMIPDLSAPLSLLIAISFARLVVRATLRFM